MSYLPKVLFFAFLLIVCLFVWGQVVPRGPQTIQAVVSAVGCLPELGAKSLMLKTLCTLIARHGETEIG